LRLRRNFYVLKNDRHFSIVAAFELISTKVPQISRSLMAKIIGICGSSRTGATEYSLKQALSESAKMSVDGLERRIAELALVLHSGRKV